MGRSGGSGDGHIGGGGGGFSGGRSGGSFGGSSRSGRSSQHSGPSGFRPGGIRTGPIIINNRPRTYYGGGGQPTGGGGRGIGALIAVMVVFAILMVAFFSFTSIGTSSSVAKSTVQREALPAGAVQETGYYTDEANWISNASTLTSGLRHFYQQTGIQPYVYIANSIPTAASWRPTSQNMADYAEQLYDQLFQDEAHFLLLFYDLGGGDYICGYWQGSQTKAVMDAEAVGILADYIDQYWSRDDVSDDEFFSLSFSKTADRIMTVTKSPWPIVLICLLVVVVIIVLFIWWKHAKAQKNREAEQTEKILNTPLEKFGDSDLSDLEKKYEDASES